MIRYGKLSDAQILKKVIEVCAKEKVSYVDDGLEAIVFTAQGDMRQVSLAPHSIIPWMRFNKYFICTGSE